MIRPEVDRRIRGREWDAGEDHVLREDGYREVSPLLDHFGRLPQGYPGLTPGYDR